MDDPRYLERKEAKHNQIEAGKRMVAASEDKAKSWQPAVGEVVAVRLSKKNQAHTLGPKVLPGIVVEIKESGYRVRYGACMRLWSLLTPVSCFPACVAPPRRSSLTGWSPSLK